MSKPRDTDDRPVDPIDLRTIDPNRVHEFIAHDTNTRCYVCNLKRHANVHTDPRR
jgi:hypothetical protein